MTPTLTCLISAFNEEKTIVRSIQSILTQSYSDFEVLIIDDGSTDGTAQVVQSFSDDRVRLVSKANSGLYSSLALGVNLAKGKYIARLDADDESLPDRLRLQVEFLEGNPDIALIGGGEEREDSIRNEYYKRIYPVEHEAILRMASKCIPYAHSALTFRSSLRDEGINYDPDYDFMGDFDFFIRVASKHRVANLPVTVVRRHVCSKSYFQATFGKARQNRRLALLCARAVQKFGLPPHYFIYPLARLIYPWLPNVLKRRIRGSQGLVEAHE